MLTIIAIFLVIGLGIAAGVIVTLACMASGFIEQLMDREFDEERL
ncbi:hypothetical protein [Massilia atriviolacea]|nr:hypothetical protein [Massilia atriviolacea]